MPVLEINTSLENSTCFQHCLILKNETILNATNLLIPVIKLCNVTLPIQFRNETEF